MAVTITRITGSGGNPPTAITVEGTATGCERVRVRCSCWATDQPVNVQNGQWAATAPNSGACACGARVEVSVTCDIGAAAEDKGFFVIDCGNCPQVAITATRAGDCVNGKRSVGITVAVTPPLTATQVLQIDFGDGTATPVITAGGPFSFTHDYLPSAAGYTVTVTVVLPQGCASATQQVAVPPCPDCCPTLSLAPPAVVDCGAGVSRASFVLNVSVPTGCAAPASYRWTVTEQSTGRQWFRSGGSSVDTQSGWSLGATAVGAIDLSGGGAFSVAAAAVGFGDCPQALAAAAFQVRARCPRITGPIGSTMAKDGCNFSFDVPVDNPCNVPLSFDWSFGDGSTLTTTSPTAPHTYAAGSNSARNVRVTLRAGGCADQVATLQVTPACGGGGGGTTTNGGGTTDGGGTMSIGCWVLLIIALVLAVVATVLGIIAACAGNPYVGIAAGIVAALAIVFLILWLVLCAAAACRVLLTIIDIVTFIVVVLGPIVGILVAIFGTPLCGLLAGIITSGYWGTLLGILVFAARRIGCLRP